MIAGVRISYLHFFIGLICSAVNFLFWFLDLILYVIRHREHILKISTEKLTSTFPFTAIETRNRKSLLLECFFVQIRAHSTLNQIEFHQRLRCE